MSPVVLVLGDSLSAGYGLPQGKGWVDLLRGKIEAERYGFKVVNASISGETTLGGRNRLPPLLATHKPAVVIVELGANDALRGTDLATTRANLKAIVDASRAASAEVLVIGMRIPPNYGPDYTTRFHELFGEVATATQSALVPFMLEAFADAPRAVPGGRHPSGRRRAAADRRHRLPEAEAAARPGETAVRPRFLADLLRETIRAPCHVAPSRPGGLPPHRNDTHAHRHRDGRRTRSVRQPPRRALALGVRRRPHSGSAEPAGAGRRRARPRRHAVQAGVPVSRPQGRRCAGGPQHRAPPRGTACSRTIAPGNPSCTAGAAASAAVR